MSDISQSGLDALVADAVAVFSRGVSPSISAIERNLRPGYKIAADVIAECEARGIVSPARSDGTRDFLAGEVEPGRAQFEALKTRIGAREPASRWFDGLPMWEQREVAIKIGVPWVPFGDMRSDDRERVRVAYRKARALWERLNRQFCGMGVVQ